MANKTSISIDPDLWDEFKSLARAEGRSATKQLERELRNAIARHQQKKDQSPSEAGFSGDSSRSTAGLVILKDHADVVEHFAPPALRAAEKPLRPSSGK